MKRRNVRYWHIADKLTAPDFVGYWTNNGQGRRRGQNGSGLDIFVER